MSYDSFRKGALILINSQMSIHQLDLLYKAVGVMYICHDGKCTNVLIEGCEE